MKAEMSQRECLAWGEILFIAGVVGAVLFGFGCTTAHFSRSISEVDGLGHITKTTDVVGEYKSNKLFKADNVDFVYNPATGEIRLKAAGMSNDPTAVIEAYGNMAEKITRAAVEAAMKAQGTP